MKKSGRPTKYTEEMLTKAQEYLKTCQDTEYIFQKMSGKTDGFEEKVKTNLPTVVGLAMHLDVNRDTLYEWAKHHEEISDILTRIMELQEQRLLDGGLSNRYNPLITKMVLMSNHGYREKTALTGENGDAIKVEGVEITIRK